MVVTWSVPGDTGDTVNKAFKAKAKAAGSTPLAIGSFKQVSYTSAAASEKKTTTKSASNMASPTAKPLCADARVGPLAGLPCAKLKVYCTNAMFKKKMAKSCPVTCGRCCVDKPTSGLGAKSCAQIKSMCTTPMFRATLRKSCPWLQ